MVCTHLKVLSVMDATATPPMTGMRDRYTGRAKKFLRNTAEKSDVKAGSAACRPCVHRVAGKRGEEDKRYPRDGSEVRCLLRQRQNNVIHRICPLPFLPEDPSQAPPRTLTMCVKLTAPAPSEMTAVMWASACMRATGDRFLRFCIVTLGACTTQQGEGGHG